MRTKPPTSPTYTLRICTQLLKQIPTQSSCDAHHCNWLTSPPAAKARMGSSMGFGLTVMSQMRACRSSLMVHMWQGEWGAQAMPLTAAWWPTSSATGRLGTRMSRMIALGESKMGGRSVTVRRDEGTKGRMVRMVIDVIEG